MTETDKVEYCRSVLIAANPGRMRDSLHLLLKTVNKITIVGLADDSTSTLQMVHELHPGLVLLDTNLPGEDVTSLLKRIKGNGTRSRCLVLANNFEQQGKAEAAGADMTLVKGFATAKLFQTIEHLLTGKR